MMKCCKKEYPKPDIVDGTAYFICSECGEVREIENYRVYTDEERIELFENQFGLKLPPKYIKYAGFNKSVVVKLPTCKTPATEFYFGDGFYEVGVFFGLDSNERNSIFDSSYLVDTWDLPKKLVLIDGDGHTWLALDYRGISKEPMVIVIESGHSESLVVAKNFDEFVKQLLPYERVYDKDGKVIYNE